MDDRMGSNINGPSLIRVPDWVPDPLGRYYLYFAHHHGTYIFHSNAGDCPEGVLLSTIQLKPDWTQWRDSDPITVLEPEMHYEGVDLPLVPSERGAADERVRQLRDPCIFEEGDKTYLLYAVAGEYGIAIAELTQDT
jgi:hypothetical protein